MDDETGREASAKAAGDDRKAFDARDARCEKAIIECYQT